jgi:hypothetical protein
MTTTTAHKQHISAATTGLMGGDVRVLKAKRAHAVPKVSEKTRRTFEAISDPKNAHLFTVEASLKAFAHIKV